MPNSIKQELDVLIRSRYPIIYVITSEEQRLEQILNEIAQVRNKELVLWSLTRGLVPFGKSLQSRKQVDKKTMDPINALDAVYDYMDPTVFVFQDFHAFLKDPGVIRKTREVASWIKESYNTLVITSPAQCIPLELEKEITVIRFALPGYAEMNTLLDKIINEVKDNPKVNVEVNKEIRDKILNAALGLTWQEAENVFARALIQNQRLDQESITLILEEKRQLIQKSGLLEYFSAEEDLGDVGGLAYLKSWFLKRGAAFSQEAVEFGLPAPKGVLLLGVQGCGKSLCAKAISRLWRLPLLRLDMGRIFSSLVGSSEQNLRNAIDVAESVAPAVLWVDEVEKAFAGLGSSGVSDAGTASRVFGGFITWLQEKKSPVFVIATANDISRLPPELMRKGRLDEIFFVDLPDFEERKAIFAIHLRKNRQDPKDFNLDVLSRAAEEFSGSEIEQVVISGLFEVFASRGKLTTEVLMKCIKDTVPLSRTMSDQISALREWAKGRARPANASAKPAERKSTLEF